MRALKTVVVVVIAIFVVCVSVQAQQKEVKYFGKSGVKEVPAAEAHFFEVTERNASGGGTKTRYHAADSVKVSHYSFGSLDGGEHQGSLMSGPYSEWHSNGNPKKEGFYSKNKLNGLHKAWYESGELRYIRNYKDNLAQDSLIGYYRSGKVRRVEVYDAGRMITGTLYDEAGKELKFFPMQEMPQFPGGEQAMLRWLGSNIKYPKSMRKAGVKGLVVIAFIVNTEGKISDLELIKSLHPEGDAEAIRVINSMPTWNPGKEEGEPVQVRYTLPIMYSM